MVMVRSVLAAALALALALSPSLAGVGAGAAPILVSANVYDIDTSVTVQSAFSQSTGSAIDPSTVTLYVRDPTGAVTTIAMGSLTHVGTGVWAYNINANVSGTWFYKFQGAGNVVVTSPDASFLIRSSKLISG